MREGEVVEKFAYIEWNDSYSIGFSHIDNQHKKLVGIVNTFYDSLKKDRGSDNSLAYSILNRLVSYAEEHFMDEELAMEQARCPDSLIAEHKAIHEELVRAIFEITEKITSSADTSTHALTEVGALLQKWLLEHILDEDMRYAPYVSKLKGGLRGRA